MLIVLLCFYFKVRSKIRDNFRGLYCDGGLTNSELQDLCGVDKTKLVRSRSDFAEL